MVKSLYTGVSGMKTHQQKMDVIGNNIANVNTTGYKTNVVTFADVYYQTKKSPSGASTTLGGVNPTQVGYGVKMNTTTPNMTQSGFTFSDSIYDMAIDGKGFFQVMDGAGNILYTRAGIFKVDEEGNLVNASGYKVRFRRSARRKPAHQDNYSGYRREVLQRYQDYQRLRCHYRRFRPFGQH